MLIPGESVQHVHGDCEDLEEKLAWGQLISMASIFDLEC